MTLKNITEKVKSVLSLGSHLWQELQHYFTLCYQMVRSFLDCLYLALDNGNYAIQPNNRILWNISNFTIRDDIPDYKVQTTSWNVENQGWVTEDTDKMFYKIEDK